MLTQYCSINHLQFFHPFIGLNILYFNWFNQTWLLKQLHYDNWTKRIFDSSLDQWFLIYDICLDAPVDMIGLNRRKQYRRCTWSHLRYRRIPKKAVSSGPCLTIPSIELLIDAITQKQLRCRRISMRAHITEPVDSRMFNSAQFSDDSLISGRSMNFLW